MKSFLSLRRPRPSLPLLLTSVVDVFLILLLFLLKTYSAETSSFSLPPAVRLPLAVGTPMVDDSIHVELAKNQLSIEGKNIPISRDERGFLSKGSSKEWTDTLREARLNRPEADSLLLVADAQLSYQTLQPLIRAAESVGLLRWNLVVARP